MQKNTIIPFIVALSFFMEAVDSTVLNTAIPVMAHSLQVDPVDLKIGLISYLLSLAIFIPISGWLADKFGEKRLFIGALTVFTLSSLACGFAQNIVQLTIGRFIQGLGGAFGLPIGRLILIRTFGREHFITTMNSVVMVGALGMMLGPVIGGIITHYFSWHWIFWINIPIGSIGILLSTYYLQVVEPSPVYPLDKIGFILFGASLAGLTFGLSALSETSVSLTNAVLTIVLSIILLLTYVFHSRRQSYPIVKTDLLRFRTFRVSVTANLLLRIGLGGMPFLVPLFLQIDLKFSPQLSGLLLAPLALGVLLSKPCALYFLRVLGYKRLLILNTLCAGIIIIAFTLIHANIPRLSIASLTFLYGFVLSLQYSAMNSLAYADLSPSDLSAANSIMSTIQQLAQSFGVAVSALLIRVFTALFSMQLTMLVFHVTFFTLGLMVMIAAAIFIPLELEDGHQMLSS